MNRPTPLKLDKKIVIWSLVLYFTLAIPLSIIHELGHGAICAADGFSYRVWLDYTGGHMACAGQPANKILYGAAGPLVGLAVSGAIAGAYVLKRHYTLLVVGLAYAVDQGMKVILEGFATGFYVSRTAETIIPGIQVGALMILMIYFARKSYLKGKEIEK